jgi:hypothetical protein
MPLIFQKWITREDLRNNPESVYIFGDNALRFGLRGQAKECRGEPNAVGIITKRAPNNDPESFMNDADLKRFRLHYLEIFNYLTLCLIAGKTVVWPEDGVGTGLADLPNKAPAIHREISLYLEGLKALNKTIEARADAA